MTAVATVELRGSAPRADDVLTPDAVAFVAGLQERFGQRRRELLQARAARRAEQRFCETCGRLKILGERTCDCD